ncbi:MAG: hypothetical protein JWO27_556 [Frankiales bacterium]|jgi:hypothetical protein|nr:hypothetical protein [Frankiales bacterium]MCW2707481.1 hypothetical protein [Frankiales bacterium]
MRVRNEWIFHYPVRMQRAVRNALLLSFAAEVMALLTGRIPWPSLLIALASASYLVEAVEKWRQERRPAQPADLATAFNLSHLKTVSVSAGGPRRLAPLHQASRTRKATKQRADVGDGAIEVVDLDAELADHGDELLQRA